ncbi:MAG: hypothetical protein RLZZ196_708 [Bacteroidota bacterium]|jgi:hypothetical protein
MAFKQTALKFRPQDYNKRRWLVWQRKTGEHRSLYNWQNYLPNKIRKKAKYSQLMQIGAHLHYLGCHAPPNIRKKWYQAWLRFTKHYPKF